MSAAIKLALVPAVAEHPRRNSRRDLAIIAGVTAFAAAYATVRYNLFKGVPWVDWPGYVFNKVLAVTSLVLLAWAAARKLRGAGRSATLMTWGGGAALGHTLLSFTLLQPQYFEKLFAAGKLTCAGGFSMAAGASAYVLLEIGARRSHQWSRRTGTAALMAVLVLGGAHTAVPSALGWLTPLIWPGYLPPLTLLATAPPIAVIVWWARGRVATWVLGSRARA